MSSPNPRRHAYRRFSDERIWREFMCAALPVVCDRLTGRMLDAGEAATLADEAYAEYRKRFPIREPELDDEPDTPSEETVRPQ
jgi:hypothetical protein